MCAIIADSLMSTSNEMCGGFFCTHHEALLCNCTAMQLRDSFHVLKVGMLQPLLFLGEHTIWFLCTEVVREGSRRFAVSECV